MSDPGAGTHATPRPSELAKPLAARVEGYSVSKLIAENFLAKLQVSFGSYHIGDVCVHIVTKNKEGENEEEQISFITAEENEGVPSGTVVLAENPEGLRKALDLLDQLSSAERA
jgi:hypothetical protein